MNKGMLQICSCQAMGLAVVLMALMAFFVLKCRKEAKPNQIAVVEFVTLVLLLKYVIQHATLACSCVNPCSSNCVFTCQIYKCQF
jgi:hypothetical protein